MSALAIAPASATAITGGSTLKDVVPVQTESVRYGGGAGGHFGGARLGGGNFARGSFASVARPGRGVAWNGLARRGAVLDGGYGYRRYGNWGHGYRRYGGWGYGYPYWGWGVGAAAIAASAWPYYYDYGNGYGNDCPGVWAYNQYGQLECFLTY